MSLKIMSQQLQIAHYINIIIRFKSQNMFDQLPITQQPKSQIQSKRFCMQNIRANQERDKIKKSIRFTNLSQLLIKQHQSKAHFITHLPLQEAQHALQQMLDKQQFSLLACCLLSLQHRTNITEEFHVLIPREFMYQLVKMTNEMMYQPQVIAIFKCLSGRSSEFHEVMFEDPQVVRNIVREIGRMKGGVAQEVYLQVLEDVCPSYSKRWQKDSNQLFNEIFQMLQNQTISFEPGLSILKSLSPFINTQLTFSTTIIHRLLREYQQKIQSRQQHQLLQNIFLILTKVIYYTQTTDIITSWRILQIVLHADQVLNQKVIQGYYNSHLLLAKLIDKISRHEMCELSSTSARDLVCRLIEEFGVDYLDCTQKPLYEVTSMLINHLLTHTPLLKLKEFTPSYLYLFLVMARHCHHEALICHLVQNQYLQFLVDCVDHLDLEICGLAIQTFVILLESTTDTSETFVYIKDYCNLKAVLQNKLYKSSNPAIVRDASLILEKFELFGAEY